MKDQDPLIKPGRPRLEVDAELVMRLRDEEHLGWTRAAREYRDRTGQWISRDTFKRRYLEAKAIEGLKTITIPKIKVTIKSPMDKFLEEWPRILREL